jgi:alpha-beta hydrolase superfamily lysophospholipase
MTPPTYQTQQAWRAIQSFLPTRLHLTPTSQPTEEFWSNRGHQLHVDRWSVPAPKARLILHHGIGTNGRQMSMILGVPLTAAGVEVLALDMPGYGMTVRAAGSAHTYADWVDIACDFFEREAADGVPTFLYGLSAGGMLTMHVAAQLRARGRRAPAGIVAMCFMDFRDQKVRDAASSNLFMSRVGVPSAGLMNAVGLGWLRIPFRLASKMTTLVNDKDLLRVCLQDGTSANAWVSFRFIHGFMSHQPALEWEDFDACPILWTQPMQDRWVPYGITRQFVDRVGKVETTIVELDGAGHYPVEEPGLTKMGEAIIEFIQKNIA